VPYGWRPGVTAARRGRRARNRRCEIETGSTLDNAIVMFLGFGMSGQGTGRGQGNEIGPGAQ